MLSYYSMEKINSNIESSFNKSDPEIIKMLQHPVSILPNRVYKEFRNFMPMTWGWADLFSADDSIRVVFDVNTFEQVDTIENTKRARKKYFSSLPDEVNAVRKSFLGRKIRIQEAFNLYDKYKNILRQPLLDRGLPLILSYLPVTETHMTNAVSSAWAVGFWQLTRGASGDLMINRYVDERRSPVLATERAADFLEGLYNIFPEWKLTATAYIRGPKGQAEDLEEMLGFEKPGKLFDSYSDMVSFHQPTDFKKYDYEKFSDLIRMSKPTLWKQTYRSFKGKETERKEMTAIKLYLDYLTDFSGENIVNASLAEIKKTDYTMISFFDYYNLSDTDIYMQYHQFLKGTKNNFFTPQYVLETIALAWMHNNGFQYEKAESIEIEEIELKARQVKEFISDNDMELNGHIKNKAIRNNYVPKGTIGHMIVE